MCVKCGYTINQNKALESAMKIALTQQLAGGIAEFALGAISLFGNGFEKDYSSERPTKNEQTEEVKDKKTEDTTQLKKEVVEILEKAEYKVSDEVLEEVVKKYATMKQFNSGKISLEQRVVNYAKALNNYGKAEQAFGQGNTNASYEISGVKEAKAEGNMEKYIAAYNNAADEYIELHDDKAGDGRIGFTEYIAKETADAGIDIDSLSDQEAKAKFAAEYIAFQALDLNQSGYLEKNEVAGMINWTSVQDNNGDDITFEDNKSFGEDIANYATSTLKLNEEDTKLFLKYMKEDNRGAALQLLKDKTNMDEKEFNNIVNAFKGYTEATKAFTKA